MGEYSPIDSENDKKEGGAMAPPSFFYCIIPYGLNYFVVSLLEGLVKSILIFVIDDKNM